MQALHFGAGNIGKGFIGYLLNKSGYEVCFVDVNQQLVDRLNQNNRYEVKLLDDNHTVETISPVFALNGITNQEEIINKIVDADIITTSVGVSNLDKIANILAKGLLKRARENRKKVDVIANENTINASSILKKEIKKFLSDIEMNEICSFVGFPNSAVDRLALSEQGEDGERTLVEPFYEWIINKSEMMNVDLPPIKDVIYVENLLPYIERKLYIVNMGHAATAYIGFLSGENTIQSSLENSKIEHFVRETMNESAQYILRKFDFQAQSMNDYIDKTLIRFKNKNISDHVSRVGRSPIRKLSFDDRLVKPTRELYEWGLSVEHLTTAIAAGFLFDHSQDEESVIIQQYIKENGIEKAIPHFTQIKNQKLIDKIKEKYDLLSNRDLVFISTKV